MTHNHTFPQGRAPPNDANKELELTLQAAHWKVSPGWPLLR